MHTSSIDPLNPYAERFEARTGPGDDRPTFWEVLHDNNVVGKWEGKVALVTGGAAGIGIETVKGLHSTGADVYFTTRNMEKAKIILEDLKKTSQGKGNIGAIFMDMDSLDSVRSAVTDFLSRSRKLHLLVNNAGIMACPESRTQDGFERQFGVNHLAHYLLTVCLLPTLVDSSTPEYKSRVIIVASSGHRGGTVDFDNYQFDIPGTYDPWKSYGQSKTACIWTANYIDRHFGSRGVHALSVHPGGIRTALQTNVDKETEKAWENNPQIVKMWMTPEQGAATTIWAAVGSVWEGRGGEYLTMCKIAETQSADEEVDLEKAAPWIHEPENEDRLWELSASLVGVGPTS